MFVVATKQPSKLSNHVRSEVLSSAVHDAWARWLAINIDSCEALIRRLDTEIFWERAVYYETQLQRGVPRSRIRFEIQQEVREAMDKHLQEPVPVGEIDVTVLPAENKYNRPPHIKHDEDGKTEPFCKFGNEAGTYPDIVQMPFGMDQGHCVPNSFLHAMLFLLYAKLFSLYTLLCTFTKAPMSDLLSLLFKRRGQDGEIVRRLRQIALAIHTPIWLHEICTPVQWLTDVFDWNTVIDRIRRCPKCSFMREIPFGSPNLCLGEIMQMKNLRHAPDLRCTRPHCGSKLRTHIILPYAGFVLDCYTNCREMVKLSELRKTLAGNINFGKDHTYRPVAALVGLHKSTCLPEKCTKNEDEPVNQKHHMILVTISEDGRLEKVCDANLMSWSTELLDLNKLMPEIYYLIFARASEQQQSVTMEASLTQHDVSKNRPNTSELIVGKVSKRSRAYQVGRNLIKRLRQIAARLNPAKLFS